MKKAHGSSHAFGLGGTAALFWVLTGAVILLAFAYVWLINMSVYSIVERKNMGEENTLLSQEIAPLEARYLALSQEVTIEKARELGFSELKRVEYAKAGEPKTALSRSN